MKLLSFLLCAGIAWGQSELASRILTSTCQTDSTVACSGSRTVQATSADAFVDSEGTLFDPTGDDYGFSKVFTMEAGFRHIRSGGFSSTYVTRILDMAAAGLKTQLVISTNAGAYSIDPTTFWSGRGQTTSLVSWLKAQGLTSAVDVIEGPNELNLEYGNTYWLAADFPSTPLSGSSSSSKWLGEYGNAYARATYAAIKGDVATAGMKVLGPAPAYLPGNPFVVATGGASTLHLRGYADWGGCHPYATGGNGNGLGATSYGGSAYYGAYTLNPSEELGDNGDAGNATAWNRCNQTTSGGTLYGSLPLAPSEQGYPTSLVSEDIQAKYYPRIYAEMFRHGMPRTVTYRFNDFGSDDTFGEGRFGLMRPDKSLKPSFFAMKSLNNLLAEPGASFSPGTLTYSVAVSTNGAFTRTQYMHDLLLQKSNGDFYLLFWHEIAGVKKQNDDGSAISGVATTLTTLPLPVTFTLPTGIVSATLYTYDSGYKLVPSVQSITSHQVSVQAKDTISVLRLSTSAAPTGNTVRGSFSGSFHFD